MSRSSAAATTGWSRPTTSPSAGLETVVLERREIVGGCAVTEEFAPGLPRLDGRLRPQHAARARLAGPSPGRARDHGRSGRARAEPGARRLVAPPRRRPGRHPARVREVLRGGRASPPRLRGGAGAHRRPDHAAHRHDSPGPAQPAAPRAREAREAGRDGGAPPVADRRRDLPVRHVRHAVPARMVRVRAGPRGARLARDQRLDRGAVHPGHRLRAPPRPRLGAGRRRHPAMGLRAGRHRPPARGDGRRRARGRRHGQDRGAGRPDRRRGRPRGRGRPRKRRGGPRAPRPFERRPEDDAARAWSAKGSCPSASVPRSAPTAAREPA